MYRPFKALLSFVLLFNLTLSDNDIEHNSKSPFELDEYLNGTFHNKGWNGTWISDDSFLMRDNDFNVYKVIASDLRTELLLNVDIFKNFSGSSFTTNSDLKCILIEYNKKAIFRHSTTAQFAIYDIENKHYYYLADKKHISLAKWSPKGSSLIYVLDNNIYYVSSPENVVQPVQITSDGVPGVIYNGVPDWVYEEEVLGSGSAVWFSPNGKQLAFASFNDTDVRRFNYLMYGEPSTLNDQYPTVVTIRYPKVGTPNPKVIVKYVNLENPKTIHTLTNIIPVNYVTNDHVLQDVAWKDDKNVVAVSLNRIQNQGAIVGWNVDADRYFEVRTLSESRGWLEIKAPIYSKDGSKYIMVNSEPEDDDTYKHIVLFKSGSDQEKTRLTYGKKAVLGIYGWNEASNLIYYSGTKSGDPAQQHVYSVNTNTLEDKCLTCDFETPEGLCKYASGSFSKSLSYYARICSGPGPAVVDVVNAETLKSYTWEDNKIIRNQLIHKQLPVEKYIKVPVGGGYEARVRLLLPPGLNEDKKYPLIVEVYGGPGSSKVTNTFSLGVQNYFVTNRQYIYAHIDSRGTSRGGENYMFTMYRQLGTIEIEDQITVTRYLQKHFSFIDASKTGIWGWSYGGFSSTWTLIKDAENVFKFGLAVAPVTNFIYYDSIYTERYMGLPTPNDNEGGYNNTDAARNVEGIRNKNFLLIHGNGDDNVHYQQAMMLTKALERADIPFYQQSYPDENHSIGGVSRHLYHTIDRFFDYSIRSTHPNKWRFEKLYKNRYV